MDTFSKVDLLFYLKMHVTAMLACAQISNLLKSAEARSCQIVACESHVVHFSCNYGSLT